MKVTNQTRLNMVIGYPLGHSQSPVLHNAIYQHLGMNSVLLAQPHLDINALIQSIKTLAVELTAVTLPYKNQVIQYLDACSDDSKMIGAVNTIIQRDGKLHGYNTDIDGIAFALRDVDMHQKNVLMIGAGGAARAMSYFLQKNACNIFYLNRTKENAYALSAIFGGNVISMNEVSTKQIDIIINTTCIGMFPECDVSPLPEYTFNQHQVVFDMVYRPFITMLLNQASLANAHIISGLDMFIGQGIKQIELLTGNKIESPDLIHKMQKLLIQEQGVASQ